MTQIKLDMPADFPGGKEAVEKIQKAFDELVAVCERSVKELKNQEEILKDAAIQIHILTQTSIDMSKTLKAVFSVLGGKKDLFKGDKDMEILMNHLATYVVSAGAIKLGVIANADKESPGE